MKKLAALTLSLFLTAGTALADTPKDATPQATKEAQTAAKKKQAAAPKKSAEKSATETLSAEVAQLRQMLAQQAQQMEAQQKMMREQQEKLQSLTEELRTTQSAASSAAAAAKEAKEQQGEVGVVAGQVEAVADATNDLTKKVAALDKDYQGEKKSLGDKIKAIGPFNFSGDFRLRDEPFMGGPTNQSQVRNRARFRARLNLNAKFNEDISGGLSLASGDLNDPISTNQSLNQFYTRKPFALDRAFITYTPHQFKPLALLGGKFAYPWYRTELTWDNDLNPEGLAQTLQWNFKNTTPVIRRFALVGFELPFTEVQHTAGANRSRVQSVVYGGQVQAVWELASWLKLSTYAGYYNYHNPDAIAFALATAGGNPQTPAVGLLPVGGASVQNSIYTTTRQNFLTTDALGNALPAPLATGSVTTINAQFASKFGLFDGIARFDIKTSMPRLPIVILGDYVQNTRACANVGNLAALGSTPSPIIATTTSVTTVARNAACNSRERRGYWLEGRVGRLSEVKDVQFAYTRMMIEREAVMGAFNFSDLRQNSNVSQHRLEVSYQAYKNIQLAFTGLFGRPLTWNTTATPEPILKRLQFDVIYKF